VNRSFASASVRPKCRARRWISNSLTEAEAKERFTYRYRSPDGDEQVLRHHKDHIYASVCRFFDRDKRRCTVYEARPNVCRRYPYGKACGYYTFLKFEREHQGDDEFIPSA